MPSVQRKGTRISSTNPVSCTEFLPLPLRHHIRQHRHRHPRQDLRHHRQPRHRHPRQERRHLHPRHLLPLRKPVEKYAGIFFICGVTKKYVYRQKAKQQCCGSGAFFLPLNPGWVKNQDPDPG